MAAPAWAEAAVAATETSRGRGILLAALALPIAQPALADTPPERASIAYKYLDYLDFQPGWDRIGVQSHALAAVLPIAGKWSVEGTLVSDTVSGASPLYHSQKFRSAEMHDQRTGVDFQIARFFPRGSFRFSVADSTESDYHSSAYAATGTWSTESKNTTFTLGVGKTDDLVNATKMRVFKQPKVVYEGMAGITQVLTKQDVVQLTVTYSSGSGDFSDPYKYRDQRPNTKYQDTVLARWNHHFAATDGTARLGYRYYRDSFDIRAHTFTLEYVQPLHETWTVTPFLRYHAQSSAWFYLDPVSDPFPTFAPATAIQSQDQRLAAFGAGSLGVKVAKYLTPDLMADFRYERYEQRSGWYGFGKRSTGIDPFGADIFQVGLTWFF